MSKDKGMEAYRRKYWDIKNLFLKSALRLLQLPSPDEVGLGGSSPEQLERKLQELDCFIWNVTEEFQREKEEMGLILRASKELRSRQDSLPEDPPAFERRDGARAETGLEEEESLGGAEPDPVPNDDKDNKDQDQEQDLEGEEEEERDHEKNSFEEEPDESVQKEAPSGLTEESSDAKKKLLKNCSILDVESTSGGSSQSEPESEDPEISGQKSESEDPEIAELNRAMRKLKSDGRVKAAKSKSIIGSSESGEGDQAKSTSPEELEGSSTADTVSAAPEFSSALEEPINSAAASSERNNGNDGVSLQLVKTSGLLISESKKDGNMLNAGKDIESMDIDSDELDPSGLSTESSIKKNLGRIYSVPGFESKSGGSVRNNNREESESKDQEIAEQKLKLSTALKKFVDAIASSESREVDRRKSTPQKELGRSSIVNTVSESVLSSAVEQPAKSAAVSSERKTGEDGLKTLGLPIRESNEDGNVENDGKDRDSDELDPSSDLDDPSPRRKTLRSSSRKRVLDDSESDSGHEDKQEEGVQENHGHGSVCTSSNDVRSGSLPSEFRVPDTSSSEISSGDEDASNKGKSRRVARKKLKLSHDGSEVDSVEYSEGSAAVSDDQVDDEAEDPEDSVKSPRKVKRSPSSNSSLSDSSSIQLSTLNSQKRKRSLSSNSSLSDSSSIKLSTLNSQKRKRSPSSNSSQSDSSSIKLSTLNYPKRKSSESSNSYLSDSSSKKLSTPNPPNKVQFIQRGRKNIRPLLSKAALSLETRKAETQERNRKKRCDRRNAQLKAFSRQSQDNDVAVLSGDFENELVLDRNSRTKAPVVFLDPSIAKSLQTHQSDGVMFMWNNCFETIQRYRKAGEEGSGCILAHCMGLGKTLQSIALIHTVMTCPLLKIKTVLVICPLNAAYNWYDEFDKWLKDADEKIAVKKLFELRDKGPSHRKEALKSWKKNGGVAIIHYNLFRSLIESADENPDADEQYILDCLLDPGPELVICDEGHLLKNFDAKVTKSLNRIRTKRRIILTGTPLQNNLMEYHSMVQFVKPNLLGSREEFYQNFQNPIENGQHSDSSPADVMIMKKQTHILHKLLESSVNRRDYSVLVPFLPEKQEYTLLIRMTSLQKDLYNLYLKLVGGAEGRLKNRRLLEDFCALARIWSHPYNLSETARNRQNSKQEASQKKYATDGLDPKWWNQKMPNPVKDVIQSSKYIILMEIVKRCALIGEKLLVFSQSLPSLDLMEHFLETLDKEGGSGGVNSRWRSRRDYFRIDGNTSIEDRKNASDKLNAPDSRVKLILLSTKACGVGINLVGANRVVVFDASWNPSNDMQAVFRVFRFGQKKPCYIYRLVAKDTMEEKVYNKQVVKLSLAGRVVDDHQIDRHFRKEEVERMYDPIPEGPQIRRLRSSKKKGLVPKDKILAELLGSESSEWISSFHEHDSLLESSAAEMLTDEERNTAWEEYESKRFRSPYQSLTDSEGESSGNGDDDNDSEGEDKDRNSEDNEDDEFGEKMNSCT